MPKIFISYRREDNPDAAGRIFDRLEAHFDRESLFMDVDTIPYGVDFVEYLDAAVSECDVLLAVIGERWLEARFREGPQEGLRRLDDPGDVVRIEIRSALSREIPVVPVLVGRASMPSASDLPDELKALARRNAAEVRSGRDFRDHVNRLIRGLEKLSGEQTAAARPAPRAGNLAELLRQSQHQVKEAHGRARHLVEKEQDYAGAAQVLGEIPEHVRSEKLYRAICQQRDTVAKLESKIQTAVQKLRLDGLRPKVEQLLKLLPRRKDLRELLETLPADTAKPGTVAHATPTKSRPALAIAPFDAETARKHQANWAEYLQTDVVVTHSVGMELMLVPPGEFQMGGDKRAGEEAREFKTNARKFLAEYPQHAVRITQPFYLGAHEVTQGEWEQVMGTRPWSGDENAKEGEEYAAMKVSWDDAQAFCERMSRREGLAYRLPTEAEWEYACRAGTITRYSFGDDPSHLKDYAWYNDNAREKGEEYAHGVGQKQPNPWGLYDMHGNVWEWCADWYSDDYYSQGTKGPMDDPQGPVHGSSRVYRGGSVSSAARSCRSAFRSMGMPASRSYLLGLRVAVALSSK